MINDTLWFIQNLGRFWRKRRCQYGDDLCFNPINHVFITGSLCGGVDVALEIIDCIQDVMNASYKT